MSLRAITFGISDLTTGRGLALALVCPEARYASIAWRGGRIGSTATTQHSRSGRSSNWTSQSGSHRGPLNSTSAVVAVLLDSDRRRSLIGQYMSVVPVEVVRVLDALLCPPAECHDFRVNSREAVSHDASRRAIRVEIGRPV